MDAVMSPSTEVRVSKYTPLVVLGRGGMGTVYLAVARGPGGFNKLQVVKFLRPELAEDEEFLKMFMDEARLSASINHTNVVQTNEVGQDGDQYYIAMEYVEGKTLLSILGRAKKLTPLPLGMHLRILCDALTGLHCAHELNDIDGTPLRVVHRDVSPQNIMVNYEGQVKVLDFGIAKAANSSSETRSGVLKGKFGYMSPEQMLGGETDRRADVYAAGVMMWQAITNHRLFKVGMSDMEIFSQVTTGELPRPSAVAEVPQELERICMRALAQKPADRYATAAELQQEIEAWLQSSGDHTTNRDVGLFVSTLYAEDRRKLKTAIEERLRAVRAGSTTQSFPTLDAPAAAGGASSLTSSSSSISAGSSGARSSPDRKRNGIILAAVAALGVTAAIAFAVRQSTKATGRTTDATSSPSSAAPSAEAAKTELKVSVTPAEAGVFVDGKQLALVSGSGTLPRDNAAHTLRVEAAGYSPVSQTVVLDAPKVFVAISLEKLGSPIPSARPTASPTTAPPVVKGQSPRWRSGTTNGSTEPSSTAPPSTPAAPANTEMRGKPSKLNDPLDNSDPWK